MIDKVYEVDRVRTLKNPNGIKTFIEFGNHQIFIPTPMNDVLLENISKIKKSVDIKMKYIGLVEGHATVFFIIIVKSILL